MPDASEHALSYVEYDGVKFGKLSVTDRTVLLRDFKKQAKADLKDTLKESGLAPEAVYGELRVYDLEIWGVRRWVELVNSFDGQQQVFRTALLKHNPEDKIDSLLSSLTLTPAESVERACVLSCLPYEAPNLSPPDMKQVGIVDGKPVFTYADSSDKDEAGAKNPTNPTGNPPAYGMETPEKTE